MKKHAALMTIGALLTLAMTAPSFAEGSTHAVHHARASAPSTYNGYYDTAAPSYGDYGANSGAMGGVGR